MGMRGRVRDQNGASATQPPEGEWWWPVVGALLLAQFAVTAIIKFNKGLGDDVLWMSHMSLVIAGAGLIMRRPWLVAAALTGILFTHSLWLFDLTAWLLGFGFPLRISHYMEGASLSTWVSTGHHLYVLPFLLWIVLRRGRYPWGALPAIMLIFVALTAMSYWFTDPARNVNRVHGIEPDFGFPPFIWANELREDAPNGLRGNAVYLLALNALSAAILFIPMAALLHILTVLIHRRSGRGRKERA